MEDKIKDTDSTDSASSQYSEKTGLLFGALVLSLVPVFYVCLVISTEGIMLIFSILIFPIILFVFIAPIIGMVIGLSFLGNGEGHIVEKIIAVIAAALPILTLIFTAIYFSNTTTGITFSM